MYTMWILSIVLVVVAFDAAMGCTYTNAEAVAHVKSVGIEIHSSGGCSDRNNPRCTSLEQVRCNTITCIKALKTSSKCSLTITGGTETGHASGTYSHWTGYKLDVSLNSCIDYYVTHDFTYIGPRSGDHAPQYRAPSGNIYAKEGDHWDILYTNAC